MKKVFGLIVVLVLCVVLLCSCSATGIMDSKKDYNRGGDTVSGEVESLEVNWTAGSVTIAYHAENTVIISESADREIPEDEKLLWKLDGKTLKIEFHKPGLVKLSTLAKNLTVTLPEGRKLTKAEIGATSADITIPALQADEVILGSTSGDTDASLEAKTVKASSTSGDVKLKLTGKQDRVETGSTSGHTSLVAEDIEKASLGSTSGNISLEAKRFGTVSAESTSGKIAARAGAFSEMKLGSTSGSIDAALPQEPGFTAEISTTSGAVNSSIPMANKGNTYTCGDGSGKLNIHATSGDVTLTPAE